MRDKASPETQVFLLLARDAIGGKRTQPTDVPAPGTIDWKRFTDLITYHELYSFFYAELVCRDE